MSDDTPISRRTAIKTLSAAGASLAFGATAGAAAAESGEGDKEIPYDGFERPFPEKSVTRIDSSVRAVTAHPEMLVISEEAVDRHFDDSGLSGQKYEQARGYVDDLRKEYPVEHVSDGDDTVIRLARAARAEPIYPDKHDDDERRAHQLAIDVFAGDEPNHGHDEKFVGPNWSQSHHRDITEALLDSADASISPSYTVIQASDDPDDFGEEAKGEVDGVCDQIDLGLLNGFKDQACDIVENALDVFHSNYAQYHDPSVGSIPFGPFGSIDIPVSLGKAPEATNVFYYDADFNDSEEKFGWSLHYLQDMAQPLHAGMGIEQAGFEMTWTGPELNPKYWVHYGFEDLLRDYWDQSPGFSFDEPMIDIMKDGDTPGYVYPETAAENMSETSTQYASDIFYEIYENETQRDYDTWDWYTKYVVYQDLANCYSELGYLGRGLIEKYA